MAKKKSDISRHPLVVAIVTAALAGIVAFGSCSVATYRDVGVMQEKISSIDKKIDKLTESHGSTAKPEQVAFARPHSRQGTLPRRRLHD